MKNQIVFLIALFVIMLPINAQRNEDKKQRTTEYSVSIDCQSCVDNITKELAFEKGIRNLKFSIENKTIAVTYRPDRISKEKIAEKIRDLGYEVSELQPEKEKGKK